MGSGAKEPGPLPGRLAEFAGNRATPVVVRRDRRNRLARLPAIHADPFEGMLVAQAKTEPLLLLTNDAILSGYSDCIELVPSKPRRG